MKILRITALALAALVSSTAFAYHHVPVTRCIGMEHTAKSTVWNVRIDIDHNQVHINRYRYPIELYEITNKGIAMYTPTQAGRYYAIIGEKHNVFLAQFRVNPDAPLWSAKLVCHRERG